MWTWNTLPIILKTWIDYKANKEWQLKNLFCVGITTSRILLLWWKTFGDTIPSQMLSSALRGECSPLTVLFCLLVVPTFLKSSAKCLSTSILLCSSKGYPSRIYILCSPSCIQGRWLYQLGVIWPRSFEQLKIFKSKVLPQCPLTHCLFCILCRHRWKNVTLLF